MLRRILIVSVILGLGCKGGEDEAASAANGPQAAEPSKAAPPSASAEGPSAEGPSAEGPSAEGPSAEGPSAKGPSAKAGSSEEASPTAPSIQMTHTHAVEPAADVAAAQQELEGLKPEDPRWVEGQHRIALAHMDAARLDEALKVFEAASKAPGASEYEHEDELLLDYGDTAMRAGQFDRAQGLLLSMIRHHHQSQLIDHTYALFADYYLGGGKVPEALQLYQKLMRDDDLPLMTYAAYRIGWCHLEGDERNDALALESFVKAVRTAATIEDEEGDHDDWGRKVGTTALEDAALVYARVGRADAARSFFTPIAGGLDVDPDVPLRRLAAAFTARGDEESAKTICRDLAEPC